MNLDRAAYEELCCYTLTLADATFIHQHVVDAFAAQAADEHTKPVSLTFALVGLYLHLERQFSGKQVQFAHMKLARRSRSWPTFPLPADRGAITAADVIARPEGPERDHAIDLWCRSMWDAYRGSREAIADLLRTHEVV